MTIGLTFQDLNVAKMSVHLLIHQCYELLLIFVRFISGYESDVYHHNIAFIFTEKEFTIGVKVIKWFYSSIMAEHNKPE